MMLKHIFTLAILAHSVLCKFPNERQMDNGDWQYCEDTCTVNCKECEVHHVCAEGEHKCGEGPSRVSSSGIPLPDCPRDEVCVDEDCYCKLKYYYI